MRHVTFHPAAWRLAAAILLTSLPAGCSRPGEAAGGTTRPDAPDPASGPKQGLTFTGKVVDKGTGKPVRGVAMYLPLSPNSDGAKLAGPDGQYPRTETTEDGTFTLPVAPGPGAVCVTARGGAYLDACVDPREFFKDALGDAAKQTGNGDWLHAATGSGAPQPWRQDEFHAVHLINPEKGAAGVRGELSVEPARKLTGTVTGPGGKPVSGAVVRNLPGDPNTPLPGAEFTLPAPNPKRPRTLFAVLTKDRLVGTLPVTADAKGPLELRLGPWATAAGRLVDAAGEPIAGAVVWANRKEPYGGGRATTDEEGRFEIEGLLPGETYVLAMVHLRKGGRPLEADKPVIVQVKAGETKVGDLKVAIK